MCMAQPLRIEHPDTVYFITSKTIGGRLWFIHNSRLEHHVLSYLARYQELYGVILYGFIFMGNHYHMVAKFPQANKADFFRSFNAMFAKLVNSYVDNFDSGKLWSRRYTDQQLPRNEDIEHWWLYCTLNPVTSGLTQNLSSYKSYNSVFDVIRNRKRIFYVFEKSKYNEHLRRKGHACKNDFITRHHLTFSRLPGLESMTEKEFRKVLTDKIEQRRIQEVENRRQAGKGFASPQALRITQVGSKPHGSLGLQKNTARPIVLSLCLKTRQRYLDKYNSVRKVYQRASIDLRNGNSQAIFPCGTYKPTVSVNVMQRRCA